MKTSSFTALAILASLTLVLSAEGVHIAAKEQAAGQLRASTGQHGSPVMFIENVGQFAEGARFKMRGADDTLWLANDAIWITRLERRQAESRRRHTLFSGEHFAPQNEDQPRQGVNIRLSFVGANPKSRIEPFDRLDTHVSYFVGSAPDEWFPDVPVWGGVRYVDLYPGIDLELIGSGGGWQPRIVSHSDANLDAVRLSVDGADSVHLEGDVLDLTTRSGRYLLPLFPVDAGTLLPGRPTVIGNEIVSPFAASTLAWQSVAPTAQLGASDLFYSTFLGGSDMDAGSAIALDASNAMYVTGQTRSSDFPATPGAFDTTYSAKDAFVAKLQPGGAALAYATFLGGSGEDKGTSIAVDASGQTYIVGYTQSSEFPTTLAAFDRSHNGSHDGFVTKLNSAGNGLVYSTFLGGSGSECYYYHGCTLALDNSGMTYIAGGTFSSNYPTTSEAFDRSKGDLGDGFVTKLNASGSGLVYSTFLGASSDDEAYAIAVDASGTAYVAGQTGSPDFPTTAGAYDRVYSTGGTSTYADAFIARLNASGSGLLYSTYLGGSFGDRCYAIAIGRDGAAYVTGNTTSSDFPTTPGAFDRTYDSEYYNGDGFVAKLNAAGSGLAYSTFLGGNAYDEGEGLAVDENGVVYVTGYTEGPDFPTTPDAFDTHSYYIDAFVTKLGASGSNLIYSTYLGGSYEEHGEGIALDRTGMVYVVGRTASSDFPTTPGAFDTVFNSSGYSEAFVAKLAMGIKYSVSGCVQDLNGNAFPGVTVSAGVGPAAVTNSGGAYTLTNLIAGTYTLTPSLPGYTFWPAIRTVTLPPNAVGQDFIILPGPVSTQLLPGVTITLIYTDLQGLPTTLVFPADAVSQATTMILTPTVVSPGSGLAFTGHAFDLTALQGGVPQTGLTFGAPVTVTIRYSNQDVRVVSDENQLRLYWWTGSQWQDAAQTCNPTSTYILDVTQNVLSVPICHASRFAMFGPTHPLYLPLALRN